jgi:hypothetical protein
MHKDTKETLDSLEKLENWDEIENTLNIIFNLLYETENRKTSAKYNRVFKHGRLTITVDYKE